MAANRYFISLVQEQLDSGTLPEDIRIPTKVGPLRDATVSWIQEAYEYLNSDEKAETRLNAWRRCTVGPWNLSWESLTSGEALSAFVREPEEVQNIITGVNKMTLVEEEMDDTPEDDPDTPMPIVEAINRIPIVTKPPTRNRRIPAIEASAMARLRRNDQPEEQKKRKERQVLEVEAAVEAAPKGYRFNFRNRNAVISYNGDTDEFEDSGSEGEESDV